MLLYAFGYIFWLNIISAKVQKSTKMSLSTASLWDRILTLVISLRVWMVWLEMFLITPAGRFCQTEMEPWPLHLWVSTDIPLCRTSQSDSMLSCSWNVSYQTSHFIKATLCKFRKNVPCSVLSENMFIWQGVFEVHVIRFIFVLIYCDSSECKYKNVHRQWQQMMTYFFITFSRS